MQGEISDESVTKQHQRHDKNIKPQMVESHGLDCWKIFNSAPFNIGALVIIIITVLNTQKKFVAVIAVTQVLEPHYEWWDLLHVIASSNEKDKGRDRC